MPVRAKEIAHTILASANEGDNVATSNQNQTPTSEDKSAQAFNVSDVTDLILQFVNAEDWVTSKAILEGNSLILSPEADAIFAQLIEAANMQHQREAAQIIRMHRDIATLCREVGIEEAFHQLATNSAQFEAPPEPDILDVIVHNTIAVLTNAPHELPSWRELVRQTFNVAAGTNNESLAGLLGAVVLLLEGEPTDKIKADLSPTYQIYWNQILKKLEAIRAATRAQIISHFDIIERNTVTVMAENGDAAKKEKWLDFVTGLNQQARDLGDDQLTALTHAVTELVAGKAPSDIDSHALSGQYLTTWKQITETPDTKPLA